MERLAPRYHVLAADSFGAGRSPAWPVDRTVTLQDEVALLEPVFARAANPFWLVGHSYGAAIALIAALSRPESVLGLILYEPVLFGLVERANPGDEALRGILDAVADSGSAIDAGNPAGAGERFIDYWMGDGAWKKFPPARQGAVAASMANVRGWGRALTEDRTPLDAFRKLNVPVLYMVGGKSPASSRAVARLLQSVLPRVTAIGFPELGHMGPVTSAGQVNEAIASFIDGATQAVAA
jgi:pimeloyl-ACP methyl ester carboxylesterase